MKLHHAPLSSNSRKVTMTARCLGLALDEHRVDLRDPASRAALAALNPNHKVPVLVDGDLVLWESHAIMQYLCAQVPGQTLYPGDPRARADVDRWLSWNAAHFSQAIGGLSFERLWKKMAGGGDPDAGQIERHLATWKQFATVLDRHLVGRTWTSGDHITLADLSLGAVLTHARAAQVPLDEYPNIVAWFGRVQALEVWKATTPPL